MEHKVTGRRHECIISFLKPKKLECNGKNQLDILRSVHHFVIYIYIVQQATQCSLNE